LNFTLDSALRILEGKPTRGGRETHSCVSVRRDRRASWHSVLAKLLQEAKAVFPYRTSLLLNEVPISLLRPTPYGLRPNPK